MDKAGKTKLARQIGRMKYEQVKPLFDEALRQRTERRETDCPNCKYNSGPNWHRCEEYESLHTGYKGRILELLPKLNDHTKTCEECHIESHWRELESLCERCEDESEIFYLYSQRLDRIAYNKDEDQFIAIHGRKPLSKLEFAEWRDAQQQR